MTAPDPGALFAGPCDFVKGVVDAEGVPLGDRPEVAFAGRSNVGKSSLVNALTGRKTLARTSNTPGRTRELNFFRLGSDRDASLYLVDLPGYGYARVSKTDAARWRTLSMAYLKGRPSLRRVFVLIDARHGLKESDRAVMKDLDTAAVSYQIILTKLDKLTRDEQNARLTGTQGDARGFIACHPDILATSAAKGWGLAEVRGVIAGFIETA